ncbi:hypothetical protein [Geomonas sp.]|uniref:hypothetical protein n=1 Tax=Geomonas sp. TaxID=2651584 RepID=UPI002B4844BC|nr:hypothetical protein [Geomonas sp.]HJV34328.1 hypothetical protein [Geomonas sp.]
MWIQRLIWFLGRMIFYMLILPLAVGTVYTLATDQWLGALIFMVLFFIVLYNGLIRVRIRAHSVVVRNDKVVFFIPEKTVRNRFDFVSRKQSIVELPSYALLDRPFAIEIFFAGHDCRVQVCRLSLKLGYIMELTGWQRAYDGYIRYQDQLPLAVKRQLYKSAANIVPSSAAPGNENLDDFLKPILSELNLGLANLGLQIEENTCTFEAGPTIARILADEQKNVELASISAEIE